MTIKQLTQKLSQFDPDSEVFMASDEEHNDVLELSQVIGGFKCAYGEAPLSREYLQEMEDNEDWSEIAEVLGIEQPFGENEAEEIRELKKKLEEFKKTAPVRILLEPI